MIYGNKNKAVVIKTMAFPWIFSYINSSMGTPHKDSFDIHIHMDMDNTGAGADIITRFLRDLQANLQQMDLPRRNGVRQTLHHNMAFYDYTLSYLLYFVYLHYFICKNKEV